VRRWAEFVLRHRRLVLGTWGIVLVAGMLLSGKTTSRLTVDFSLPGQPGTQTTDKILARFGNGGNTDPFITTVTLPAGQTVTGHEADVAKSFGAVTTALPGVRVVDEANTGDKVFRTSDDRTAYALVFYRFNPDPTAHLITADVRKAL
jgi:putative drug exporter of the RND superfamily